MLLCDTIEELSAGGTYTYTHTHALGLQIKIITISRISMSLLLNNPISSIFLAHHIL
jgi:hypothetical protein